MRSITLSEQIKPSLERVYALDLSKISCDYGNHLKDFILNIDRLNNTLSEGQKRIVSQLVDNKAQLRVIGQNIFYEEGFKDGVKAVVNALTG